MAKYDAFGREIGEDTLAGLGGSSAEREEDLIREREEAQAHAAPVDDPPRQPEAPIFEAPVAEPDPAASQPVFVPARAGRKKRSLGRRAGCGCVTLIILIPILLVALGAVVTLLGIDSEPEIETGLVDRPRPSESAEIDAGKPAKPAQPPRGLESRSLVRRANFARAMKRLRAAKLGSVSSLRVAPDWIGAQLVTKGGRLRSVRLTFDGKLDRGGGVGTGFKFVRTVPFAQINTAAPERLTRSAARRLGHKTTRLDYLVYTAGGGQFAWGAYFKGGRIAQGDGRGTFVRRIS